ncbi:MAG TPA: type VII secretion protein EccB [Mycobacterium sp.]|nr:type VII secretion protein EccB [Mycobacterium sp.]
MARQSTTKLQISGYRFLVRRMQHALVRGDVRMLDDPLRAQSLSLVAGCVLAVIGLSACAILAFMQPRGALGTAPIVMVRESGALYVRIGDTMHPVLNLASARLIAGTAANPELVSASAIDNARRGPLVGIPGAPDTIAGPLNGDESVWTVCEDASSTTTVIAGQVASHLDARQSALVTARGESAATTYLLSKGRRAEVDLRNPAVVRALKLDGVTPRPVSRALIDALPEAPPITAPHIPGIGSAGPSMMGGFTVGTVVRVTRAGAGEYYVVLEDGVQRIGEVAADLIRFTHSHGRREIVTVAPGVIGSVPILDALPVTTFPDHGGVAGDPVLCTRWTWSSTAGGVNSDVLVGNSLPMDGEDIPVKLAQADDSGPGIDIVLLPHGRSAYVRAVGVTGEGAEIGSRFIVNDFGVVFGVRDEDSAKRLGVTNLPVPAPWPLLARLPRGPELSVEGASVRRDSVRAPS